MASSTLAAIRQKVRQITRSPSENTLSTSALDDTINTFIIHDFASMIRVFNLKTTITFYTTPNVERYDTTTAPSTDPLFNFVNKYRTVEGPIYIAGYRSQLVLDRTEFFNRWPHNFTDEQIGTGDGATFAFSGTLNSSPVEQESVSFGTIDSNGEKIILVDAPQNPNTGDLIVPNDPSISYGSITYKTGAYSLNFPNNPANNAEIRAFYYRYTTGRPFLVLYYQSIFHVRPVPDKVYPITLNAYVRPTELESFDQEPELTEWWQFIAIGAAKKVFENRLDVESVQKIQPLLNEYEDKVLTATGVQNRTRRTATIFDQSSQMNHFNNSYYP